MAGITGATQGGTVGTGNLNRIVGATQGGTVATGNLNRIVGDTQGGTVATGNLGQVTPPPVLRATSNDGGLGGLMQLLGSPEGLKAIQTLFSLFSMFSQRQASPINLGNTLTGNTIPLRQPPQLGTIGGNFSTAAGNQLSTVAGNSTFAGNAAPIALDAAQADGAY
jgi:hypothetical protein